jgi:SSS family solute:Na+ symporter
MRLTAAVVSLLFAVNHPQMLAFLIWLGICLMLCFFAVLLIVGLYWRCATVAGAIAA